MHLIYDAAKVLVTTAADGGRAHKLRKGDGVIQNSQRSRLLVRPVRSLSDPLIVVVVKKPLAPRVLSSFRGQFVSFLQKVILSLSVTVSVSMSTLSYSLRLVINYGAQIQSKESSQKE